MKAKKIISLLLAVTLSAVSLVGCSSSKDEESTGGKTKIRFATWDSEESLTMQEELVNKFNAQSDTVEVVLEAYGDEFDTKLAAGMGAGDTPDVMYMWNYPLYSGALEPLDSYIEKEGAEYKSSFFDALWNYNSYDGNVYGIPVGYSTHVMYYNKDLFDKAGVPYPSGDWTWKQVEEVATKVSNKNEKIYGFAFTSQPDPYDFEMNLWNNGTAYVGSNNELEGNVNSSQAVEVYDKYQKMAKNNVALATEGSGSTEMKSGKVAMFINASWSIGGLKEQGTNFGVTLIPTFKEGSKSSSIVSSSGIAMSKDSEKKDAAWEFIKFWTSEQSNKDRIGYELPVLKSVAESEKLLDDEIYGVFYQMLEQSTEHTPTSFKVENWTEISEEIYTVQEGIFNPTTFLNPKEALDSIVK